VPRTASNPTGTPNRGPAGLIEGKHPQLGSLSDTVTVLETPHSLLAGHTITPTPVLFVRNIQQPPDLSTMEPIPLAGWNFELVGLIDEPITIVGEELLEFEQVDHEMVLQCSGNGRSKFSEASPVPGTAWGQGGVGNVVFSGPRLSDVLEKHHVKIDRRAKFVTAAGRDLPLGLDTPDFEHSLPVEDVLERSILALKLNGEPLPGIHGGPVRLATPGFYGTMHVKWLRRLRFAETESTNFYHATEYRVPKTRLKPGEQFEFTLENSVPTWKIRLMSFIFSPQPAAVLKTGVQTFSGVAFNDGAARVTSLLVSFDHGGSWREAQLQVPASPYAWYPWTIQADLKPGVYEVWSRAVDALGCSQPLDGQNFWNPNGYEWNAVHKIEVTVTTEGVEA
jgi:sulfite oxidase